MPVANRRYRYSLSRSFCIIVVIAATAVTFFYLSLAYLWEYCNWWPFSLHVHTIRSTDKSCPQNWRVASYLLQCHSFSSFVQCYCCRCCW